MPISQSAKKALRVNQRQTAINRRRKVILKSALKSASADSLPKTFSVIDKAAKWGIIARNKASRLKAKFAKAFADTAPAKAKDSKTTVAKTKAKKPATKKATAKTKAKAKKS